MGATFSLTKYLFQKEPLKYALIAGFFNLIAILASLVIPAQVASITNAFANHQITYSMIYFSISMILGAQVLASGCIWAREYSTITLSNSVISSLIMDIYRTILHQPNKYFQGIIPTDLNTRSLDDARLVYTLLLRISTIIPFSIISLFVYAGMLFHLNWQLALVVIPVCTLSAYSILFDKIIRKVGSNKVIAWSNLRVRTEEVLNSVNEVRVAGVIDYVIHNINAVVNKYTDANRSKYRFYAIYDAIKPMHEALLASTVYLVGAILVLNSTDETLQWGDIIAFMMVAKMFNGFVQELATYILEWQIITPNAIRVSEVLNESQQLQIDQSLQPFSAILNGLSIVGRNLSLASSEGSTILRKVNLQSRQGEKVVITGPAGSGKSTLLKIVCGDLEPDSGTLKLNETTISSWSRSQLADSISFVPQNTFLFDDTLRNNLLLFLRHNRGRTLNGKDGNLCVERLPFIITQKDLETHLIKLVQIVGLAQDVFLKGLDTKITSEKEELAIVNRIATLRQQISDELKIYDIQNEVLSYSANKVFPWKTLAEHISPAFKQNTKLNQLLPIIEKGLEHRFYEMLQESKELAISNGHVYKNSSIFMTPAETCLNIFTEQEFIELIGELQNLVLANSTSCLNLFYEETTWNYSYSIRENLLGGCFDHTRPGIQSRIDKIIDSVLKCHVDSYNDVLLNGLEYQVGHKGSNLSGGQQQKVALARAMLKNPDFLILDEATASMDGISLAAVSEMLRNHVHDTTVMAVTHQYSTLKNYDQIIVLDQGEVVQQGAYSELVETPGLFRDLVRQESGDPEVRITKYSSNEQIENHNISHLLSLCSIFRNLRSDELFSIEEKMTLSTFEPGETLFNRGDTAEEFYILLTGKIELLLPGENKNESSIQTLVAPEAFGEVGIFGISGRTLTARAIDSVNVAILSRSHLIELIEQNPQIGIGLLQATSSLVNWYQSNSLK